MQHAKLKQDPVLGITRALVWEAVKTLGTDPRISAAQQPKKSTSFGTSTGPAKTLISFYWVLKLICYDMDKLCKVFLQQVSQQQPSLVG